MIVKNRSWWMTLPVVGMVLVGVAVWYCWDIALSEANPLVQGLAHLFGEPVYLGPVLLGILLITIAVAFVVPRGPARTLGKYALGLGLLAVVVSEYWSYEGPDGKTIGLVTALDRPVHVGPFLLAVFALTVALLITFIRWHVLVLAQDLPFTKTNAVRLGMFGYYLSTFLPSTVGGDVIKAAYIAREQSRRTVAVATVLIDRAVGLVALMWLVALIGGTFWATGYLGDIALNAAAATFLEWIVGFALMLVVLSVLFWLLLGILPQRRADKFAGRLSRIPKLGHSLAEFWRAIWMYRCKGRSIALALVLSMIAHVGFVLTFYFAVLTLHAPDEVPTAGAHFLLAPVGMAIQAGCPTPNGVGLGEAGYGGLYKQAGFLPANGVLGSLTQRVVTWIVALAFYLIYLQMRPSQQPTVVETANEEVAMPAPALSNHYPADRPAGVLDVAPGNRLADGAP
jgi:uncharacterized protein (TIRG00374 family)